MSSYKRTFLVLSKLQNLALSGLNSTQKIYKEIRPRYLYLSTAIALSYWVTESTIHYFNYDKPTFELAPSNANELWMRISVFLLLVTFGLFIDYKFRKSIVSHRLNNKATNIHQAKKQWERVVDSLPQIVIAIDKNARIIRVNRTIEIWCAEEVNTVVGLKVSDFLKCLNEKLFIDNIEFNWDEIWQGLASCRTKEKNVENQNNSNTYLYSLKKISESDAGKEQCYAVLMIVDITAQERNEKALKERTIDLEKMVNLRTKELQLANKLLEHELNEKETAYIKLKESQQCRLALLQDIFSTQEKERKRIAIELHDSIGQRLGAAKFKMEDLVLNLENTANIQNQLSRVVDMIKHTIHETRNIAMYLRPAMIDDLGILPTLKWFSREFQNTYAHINIRLSLQIDESVIPEHYKIVIFRVTQEALNNIVKHANAMTVVIELFDNNSDIMLSISDDGDGFDINKNFTDSSKPLRCGIGLGSMRERAESTNGEFKIKSSSDKGTTVSISWKANALQVHNESSQHVLKSLPR